jgi:hypothetical protein
MNKSVFLFSLLLSSIFLSSIAFAEEWLLNPQFTNPALVFDTGIIRGKSVSESPDNWKWGYSCYKWDSSSGSYPIDWCQIKSYSYSPSDYNVYLAGDSLGLDKTGVVKLVQGNVWGGSVPWYVPPKMPISGDIYIDSWYNVKSYTGWHNAFMFDIWLKDDSTGKIMGLDLIFFTWTLSPTPIRSPWWDGSVFHYQAAVCGAGGWYHCNLNMKTHIDSAIYAAESQGVHFNRATTYIYQTEILLELIQAVAELDVGSFRMYRIPPPTGGGGGCPILRVWNGKEFVKVEKLNIHSREGIDTTYATTFNTKPINGRYEIILKEADYISLDSFLENPDGSHIDSVKLTDETGKECKLISTIHSKEGDVLRALQKSDDVRIRTLSGEEIKLTFEGCSGETFNLAVEGYNKILVKQEVSNVFLTLVLIVSIFSIALFTSMIIIYNIDDWKIDLEG